MSQLHKVRTASGETFTPAEWSSTPLWSTVEADDGSIADLQAFSYGQGGDVPGSVGPRKATLADTNMEGTGNILAENEELLIFTIMVEFFQVHSSLSNFYSSNGDMGAPTPPLMSLENVLRVQRDTLLTLHIAGQSGKHYMQQPIGFFPAGMGVHHTMGAADNEQDQSAVLAASNGSPNVSCNRKLATPHQVSPGENFTVDISFPAGSVSGLEHGTDSDARVRFRVYVDGYRRRPVA